MKISTIGRHTLFTEKFHRRGSSEVAFSILLLVLSGCASMPADKKASSEFDAFYEGKGKPLYEARGEATTAQEALGRGDAAYSLGNTDEALYEYVKALELDSKNPETLYKVGTIHAEIGNSELAETAYRMALKLAPGHAGSLEGLALMLLDKHQHPAAEQHLRAAIKSDPKRWRSHNGLGLIADMKKDYALAISHYQAALRAQPDSPLLLNNLGYSKYLAGDRVGAFQLFERALEIDPKFERAWLNKALVHARNGDTDAAFEAFRHTLDEASAYNDLGYIYMLDGRYDEAEQFFQEAISASPTYHALAHANLNQLRALQSN